MRSMPIWAALAMTLTASSCSEESAPDGLIGDKAVVNHVALSVGVPAHARLATEAEAMHTAVEAFCGGGDLAAAQASWEATMTAWQASSAFGIGPVTMDRLGSSISWPPDAEDVYDTLDAVEADPDLVVDADYVHDLGSNRRSLGAIEILLFDPWPPAGPELDRRCDLVVAMTADVSRAAAEVAARWETTYGPEMAAADNDTFMRQQAVIDALVNRHGELSESIQVGRLGTPLGEKTEGVPQPDTVQSTRSAFARAEIVAALRGMAQIYTGVDGGPGLNDAIRRRQPSLVTELEAAFDAAIAAVEAIEDPLHVAVVDHPEQVRAAFDAVRAVKLLMTTDVANVLGVTRTFSDNDGD